MSEPEQVPTAPPVKRRGRGARWVRRGALALACLLALVLLVGTVLVLSLRSVKVRRAILDRVASYLEQELGVVAAAEDVDFGLGGSIVLRGVRLGAPGAAPFVTIERVRMVADLRSLVSPVVVLRSVEIEAPRLDLSASMPTPRERPDEPDPSARRLDIHTFRVERGEVIAAPVEPEMARWVEAWGAQGITLRGSYLDELLDVHAEAVQIQVRQPGQSPQLLHLTGQIFGQLGGIMTIRNAHLTGDGLDLSASGNATLETDGMYAGDFKLAAEPGRLVPRLLPGGKLRATGSLSYPPNLGKVQLQAENLPAEGLRPFLEPSQFSDLSLAGTVFDLEGSWTWDGAPEQATGPAELTWRRNRRRLARVELNALSESEGALRLVFDGTLLPSSPGRRHVRGAVLTPSWTGLAQATNQGTAAELRIPEVGAALDELRSLWPSLVPALPEGLPARGPLEADLRLSGPFTAPDASLKASWSPEPGSSVRVQAQGKVVEPRGTAKVEVATLPLGAFAAGPLEGLDGTVSGTADLSGSLGELRTRLSMDTTSLTLPLPASLETGRIQADGVLRTEPLSFRGTVDVEGSGLVASANASTTARIATFNLRGNGTLALDRLAYTGPLELLATDLTASSLSREAGEGWGGGLDRLHLTADGSFSTNLQASAGRLELEVQGVTAPSVPPLEEVRLEARLANGEVWLPAFSAFSGERALAGSGHLTVEPLLREADLDVQLVRLVDPLQAVEASARLRQGVLELDIPRFESSAGSATLRATVPLGVLEQVPDLRDALSGIPLQLTPGPVSLSLSAPAIDSETILAALCLPPRPERVRTGLELTLTADPRSPATGTGEVRFSGLQLETRDAEGQTSRIAAEEDVLLRLANARLEVPPVRLRVDGPGIEGAGVALQATAELSPTWHPRTDPPADLLASVSLQGDGTVDAALLQPYLEGGIASGPLTFSASVSGPPSQLEAGLRLSGPEASFAFPGPFSTRIERPEAVISYRDGKAEIQSGTAIVNGGSLKLSGEWTPDGGAQIIAGLSGARYRLPDLYDLSASLSGFFELRMPKEGRWSLGGNLTVDRGVIDRDIDLDQQVLAFLAPREDAEETDPGLLGQIDLDLSFRTVDGVRMRNNVGDLRVDWAPLAIRGTLAEPEVYGRIDLEPGGLVFLYGQTARIDRGALVFTGPPTEPEPVLSVTTSLQDPTIARLRGRSPLDELDRPQFDAESSLELEEALTGGLAGYYGERVVSRLGSSLGLSSITVRPVLVFQETDPTARLTVSRELSRNAAFALSLDLRNAERQTYLLDLYGFRQLPHLTAQGFRTEADVYGASLQQTLELGGSRVPDPEGDRLRRVEIEAPAGLSRRSLRRAIRLDKGDEVLENALFDLEIDVAQALRRRGYPDARVTVSPAPVESRPGWTDLRVSVEPGPRVAFVFESTKPPRSARASITSLYRTDFYEAASVEEMRKQALRVFRSVGYLEPQAAVEIRKEGSGPEAARTVVVRSEPGSRIKLEEVVVEGIASDAVVALLQGRFSSRLARVETAAALPEADRRLLDDLRALGYPEARVAGRELAEDGSRLTVRVEPGPRQTLGEVSVAGVEGDERQKLLGILTLRPGDPARTDRIQRAAQDLEDSLRQSGYPDAAVLPVVQPGPTGPLDVTFQVAPGTRYRVQEVRFEGQRWTREASLERATGLEEGEPLSQTSLNEARDRLFQTGLFSRVVPSTEKDAEGQARVSFSLLERPRFRVAYGVRWSNEESASAVVDLVDQNFLGRGLTLGLRTLYEPEDKSARLFFRTGGLFGSRISLESYGEARRIEYEIDIEDRTEAALQLARPWGRSTTGRVYLRRRTTLVREKEPDPFFPIPDTQLAHTYVGVQAIYDGRNDVLEPTRGVFASVDLSGSEPDLLQSDLHYLRLFGQVNLFQKVATWNGRPLIWAHSTRLGLAHPFDQELTPDIGFLAGGEFSVRGYETESLGPRNFFGDPTGGEALLVLNEELRFPLLADLSGLVFFDLGQVWADASDLDTDFAKSIGLGLRARTPVGLIRGDVAFPLDRREGDPGYRFYLGFGNAF